MNRRDLLQWAVASPILAALWSCIQAKSGARVTRSRVRPGDPAWPSNAAWEQLRRDVGGQLIRIRSPLTACIEAPASAECDQIFKQLKNPYYLGDEAGLTQSLGWVDAWTTKPSVYAVKARYDSRCRHRSQLRSQQQYASRSERRRSQLSGYIQRAGLTLDLDTAYEHHHAPRCVRCGRLCGARGTAAGSYDGGRCYVGTGL